MKQAHAKGLIVSAPSTPASPSTTPSAPGFAYYLECHYLPWARSNLSPATMTARAGVLMILAEDLANTPLDRVEARRNELVDRWRKEGCRYRSGQDSLGRERNRQPRPISDSGINERIKIMRAVLGHAHMEARVLAIRPRISLVRRKRAAPGAAKPIRCFSPEERVRFLRYADAELADVFQLGLLTGMRPAELFHLRVDAVDLGAKTILVQESRCELCHGQTWLPKTGGVRRIPLCADVLPILRRLIKGKPDHALVIENQHGAPFSRLPGSGGRFISTLRRAGLARKGLSFYSLRHTFAADLLTQGSQLKDVAEILGNSVRTCELHYAHLHPGRTAEVVAVLRAVQPWPVAATAGRSSRGTPRTKEDAA
jgi:integrase